MGHGWMPARMHRRAAALALCAAASGAGPAACAPAESIPAWEDGTAIARLVLPPRDARGAELVRSTVNGYLSRSYGIELPVAEHAAPGGVFIVAGTPATNPLLADLVSRGLALAKDDIGDEGFQLRAHDHAGATYVVVYGSTPRALKHGCQELVYYHMPATLRGGAIDRPLDITAKPAFRYRGIYMLPCWAARDSLESWERVLRFNSELTLNRVWFWLDGFPVAGHTGEYGGTDLARPENVQRLIDLAGAEDMKFLIGGGWFNWHHEKAIGKDVKKGIDYYLAYIDAFTNFHGFYIEPTGEGGETARWRAESGALGELVAAVHRKRPAFEFAIAIGKFNNKEYLADMAKLDPERIFWWWCWGDPIRDRALDLYPSVLRWHTVVRMSDYHGSMAPPDPVETPLAGIATSYDPGQGFGNPWNGWGKLGADAPRDFHPHTIPYFAHQYFFRERCWNPSLSEDAFVERLGRRLFDADAPADAAACYGRLSRHVLLVNQGKQPPREELAPIRAFVGAARARARAWTARTRDTLSRMEEALAELAKR
jgi:hypothetical protein